MSDDGQTVATETRRCEDLRCGHEMTVSIRHGEPTQDDIDQRFETLGWGGYLCPKH